MEKEYIEREELKNRIHCTKEGLFFTAFKTYIDFDVVKEAVLETPTADVAEVRRGVWLPDYETFVDEWERESGPIQTGWVCSLCGRQEFQQEPYCNCGAKMDGKGESE